MANTAYLTHAFADNYRLAKSKLLSSPSDATYDIIQIPKYAFVKNVWIEVVTAADVEPDTVTVGWTGNGETAVTDGFITTDVAAANETGLKKAMHDTLTTFEGKYFNGGSGMITFTYAAGSASTKGVYRVFAEFVVIH